METELQFYEIFAEDFLFWLRMFPKVESIGTQVWNPDIGLVEYIPACYDAILQLYEEKTNTFPNLTEMIATSCLCVDKFCKVDLPISLKHVTFILRRTTDLLECFQRAISRHASTLVSLEIYWTRWHPSLPEVPLTLTFLPVLRTLVLASHTIFPEYGETCRRCLYLRGGQNCLCWMNPRETLKEVDVFKLREIFQVNGNLSIHLD